MKPGRPRPARRMAERERKSLDVGIPSMTPSRTICRCEGVYYNCYTILYYCTVFTRVALWRSETYEAYHSSRQILRLRLTMALALTLTLTLRVVEEVSACKSSTRTRTYIQDTRTRLWSDPIITKSQITHHASRSLITGPVVLPSPRHLFLPSRLAAITFRIFR